MVNIKNKDKDRSKMGFVVCKGFAFKEEIKCKNEEEVWEEIGKDWSPYIVTYEDGYWAKQFLPF